MSRRGTHEEMKVVDDAIAQDRHNVIIEGGAGMVHRYRHVDPNDGANVMLCGVRVQEPDWMTQVRDDPDCPDCLALLVEQKLTADANAEEFNSLIEELTSGWQKHTNPTPMGPASVPQPGGQRGDQDD